MRYALLLAAATLTLAGSASAQMLSNSPGKFCLRSQGGAIQGMETCTYQTMAQCNAAKAGQSDSCVPNASLKGNANLKGSAKSTTGSASKQ